jgi:hypothetical protein
MKSVFWVIALGFDVGLLEQVNPTAPAYYRINGERVHAYIFRSYTDPIRLGWLLVDGAKDTWCRDPHEWDRSPESILFESLRDGDGGLSETQRNSVLETVLQEDTRYLPSHERRLRKRFSFAVRSSVLAYKPDGKLQLAYGLLAAGVVSDTLSSTWHPLYTGTGALLGGIGQSAVDRAGGNLLPELEPDLKNFGRRAWNQLLRK